MKIAIALSIALTISFDSIAASGRHAPNPEAVAQVLAGTRSVANAAWWGFDVTGTIRVKNRHGVREALGIKRSDDEVVVKVGR